MSIWKRESPLNALTAECRNTLVSHVGIEFTELGEDCRRGRMPVDDRTRQPYGLLHGGGSVVLAETLGSMAANCCLKDKNTVAVGLDINANHIRPVTGGWVYGTARALHIGSATQVWEIRLENEQGKVTCISRLTMAVTKRP